MKTVAIIAAALLGLCIASPLTPTVRLHARRQANSVGLGRLVQDFALDVSEVLWKESGNVVFSPLSISSLMSLVMAGTAGNTYIQLRNALLYPADIQEFIIHKNYQDVLNALRSSDGDVVVNVATRLFLASGSSVLFNYTQLAQEHYGATARTLNFRSDPIGAMNSINGWVNAETRGKIPELLTQPLDARTTFVATNTVYFNGAWEHPFDPMLTSDGIFNTGSANITIPMMRTTMTVPYINMRDLNAEMIALPYKGYEYGMFLVRPNGPLDDKTLQEVEFALEAATLNNYIGQMINSTRSVVLPRMQLNFKAYLKNELRDLGVADMFSSSSADFSKLTANTHVWVDDIIHQAVVEITETGTVAAASTSISLNRIGTSNTPFQVNRPSLIYIRHMKTGIPLFWGRIMSPEPISS